MTNMGRCFPFVDIFFSKLIKSNMETLYERNIQILEWLSLFELMLSWYYIIRFHNNNDQSYKICDEYTFITIISAYT